MQPTINIQNLTLNLHMYQRVPEFAGLGEVLSSFATATPAASIVEIPELGHPWPGQGGLNGGLVPAHGDAPEHYLIIAATDLGTHEWGGRGLESGAISKTDGLANTAALIESETDYPAAEAAAEYSADGHGDFYLPAAAELYQAWVNCPDAFAKEWHWSSTQRSANVAFSQGFADGIQDLYGKYDELRVRPVRRLFI